MANRLVLSSDGGLGPEARVTLAPDEEPVDGDKWYPQSRSSHRGASAIPLGSQGSSELGLYFRGYARTLALPRAALYHKAQTLEQLRQAGDEGSLSATVLRHGLSPFILGPHSLYLQPGPCLLDEQLSALPDLGQEA